MASGVSLSRYVEWEVVVPVGPPLAFHTGCIINNFLYLHGGISQYGNTCPLNKLYRLSLEELVWNEVSVSGSPSLSHHACVVLEDRYMLLIGGWNGKKRAGDVYAFDTKEEKWITPHCVGFPSDAGLSSHTANILKNGDVLILGREGSLRIQRRTGNAFLLQGSVKKGFTYSKYSNCITSRSGHTTDIIGSTLIVIGGRSDKLIESQHGFSTDSPRYVPWLEKFLPICQQLKPVLKDPCGRKHHITMSGPGGILLHGGETFDGRSREPVGEMFFIKIKPSIEIYNLGASKLCKAGHVSCTDGTKFFIHGGITGKTNFVCCDLCELKVLDSSLEQSKKSSKHAVHQTR